MTEFSFAPATKAQAKARVALDGPSGSGKTWTALSVAMGLGQRIAVIDTERGSASKYAGDFRFDTLQMHTYDPRDLVKALSAASGAGYDVVIVDSLSHFWMGKGGMLEQVDGFTKRSSSGNSFGGWKDARPIEREMIDGLLAYPGHVIVTMRTKTEWVITENDRGRKEPKKIGLKAEQRDGLEYEFDIVGDLDLDHNLVVSKSRMSALADKVISRPDSEVGSQILAWLTDGESLPTVEDYILRVVQTEDFAVVRATFTEVQQRGMGAAPCMRNGQPTTLRQLVFERGNELAPQQQTPAVAPPAPTQETSLTPRDAADAVVRKAEREMVDIAPRVHAGQRNPFDPDFDLPPMPGSASARPATDAQLTKIAILFQEKRNVDKGRGEVARALRLKGLGEMVGREITSGRDLTLREAQEIIESLMLEPNHIADAEVVEEPQPGPDSQLGADLAAAIQEATDETELAAVMASVDGAVEGGKLPPDHGNELLASATAKRRGWSHRTTVGAGLGS